VPAVQTASHEASGGKGEEHLKNMKVSWDDSSQYMETKKCSKPPISYYYYYYYNYYYYCYLHISPIIIVTITIITFTLYEYCHPFTVHY